jgi:hypothetical protein
MTGSPLLIVILFLIAILIGLVAFFVVQVLRMMRQQPAALSDVSAPEPVPAAAAVRSFDQQGVTGREWTSTEYEITRLPLDLQVAAWAGAVPHAFDADVLLALAPGLASRAGATYLEVQKLSFVEAAPDQLHCIHAPTRAAMLAHLWTTQRASYRTYARRAARYYSQRLYSDQGGWRSALGVLLYRYVLPYSARPALQIEWLYHLAIADPEAAVTALRFLANLWTDEHRHEDVDRLLLALAEHIEAGRATDHLNAIVHYFKHAVGNINGAMFFLKCIQHFKLIATFNRIHQMRCFIPAFIGNVCHFIGYLYRRYIYFSLPDTYRTKCTIIPFSLPINFIIISRARYKTSFF